MAKAIMIQGTASNVGKSVLVAALCRIFKQDGFRVAPFKAQNMALNSYITADGLEIGRAQAMQAEACGIAPDVRMNPILLKPNSDTGSQVIVNGKVLGNRTAREYWADKSYLRPKVWEAYQSLAQDYDIIVIEGAGSPAEINLKQDDLVNMGMATLVNAPVLLVGDIDRGGVFASLYGTIQLLEPQEQKYIQGLIINKFRGDLKILEPGLVQLECLAHKPILGVIPYTKLDLDDEDSLSERLEQHTPHAAIQISIVRLPHLSNFTDFRIFEGMTEVSVQYISAPQQLEDADFIIIPGTKNTIGDLKWMRMSGIEAKIQRLYARGVPVWGICGGYQMMGRLLSDPDGVEGGGTIAGMGLLPIETTFRQTKTTTQASGVVLNSGGIFSRLSGAKSAGYEIHMGVTELLDGARPLQMLSRMNEKVEDGCWSGHAYGTYLHGFFDDPTIATLVIQALLESKGLPAQAVTVVDFVQYKQQQYDQLAAVVRKSLDMERIYQILNERTV